MEMEQFFQDVRTKYVEFYRATLRAQREQGRECTPEVWVEPNYPPGARRLPHPLCIDIMVRGAEGPEMVAVTGEVVEGALVGTMEIRGVPVKVYAAAWEAFPVWLKHADPDWSALDSWKAKWLDANRSGDPNNDGLSGVVHYLGHPTSEAGGFVYAIDFGSAPVEALAELLDVLAEMGSVRIELGRSDGSDLPSDVLSELMRPQVSLDGLNAVVKRLLASEDGVRRVEQSDPHEVRVYRHEETDAQRVFTFNLHRHLQRIPPEARAKEINQFLRGQREIRGAKGVPDLDQLRIAIKDTRFVGHVRGLGVKAKMPVMQRLAADLWQVCVWDSPNGMRFSSNDEPEKYGLTAEQMLARAQRNYLGARPEVNLVKDDGLLVAQTGDCYDASLLVDDDWWQEREAGIEGELLVCVPARHVVLIGDSAHAGILQKMQAAAGRIEAGGDHIISNTILVRRRKAWHEYQPPSVSGSPAAVSKPRPAQAVPKRPWWKLW